MKYLAVLLVILAGCTESATPLPTETRQGDGVYTKVIKSHGKEFLVVYHYKGGVAICPIPEPQ